MGKDKLSNPRLNGQGKFNESVIGTGFYRFGEANHDDCISLRQIGYDLADNQIDTLTKAFQATTVACARCHNHKFDAVSTEDYYALLGIVQSSRMVSQSIDAPDVDRLVRRRLRELKSELRQELARIWLDEARQFSRYMRAAHAKRAKRIDASRLAVELDVARLDRWVAILTSDALPRDDPFEPWGALASAASDSDFAARWRVLTEQFVKEDHERTEFNRTQFVTFADFRGGSTAGWQVQGRGLADASGRCGELVIHPLGDLAVRAILPAGQFTHTLSDKQNGTLRSPVLPVGKGYISFQVQGEHSSAVRLVSNNCQLNYKNYQALTSAELHWVTFSPPADRVKLRTYAELMTMFDNPKFPDQLSSLGGDKENYRLPWEVAAKNPRSHFGMTRVVLHDASEPPRPELNHQRRLFAGPALKSLDEFADRYATIMTASLQAWASDNTDDDDVRWLATLLRRGLLGNGVSQSTKLASLIKEYRSIEAELSLPRVTVGVSDGGPGLDQPVFLRGDYSRPGETIPRRYLEVLSSSNGSYTSQGSGRLELAGQFASADNPLTARVMVNRVWHHLFGTGLVRSVDDFGHVGDLPSHPELLDYLAARFVADGWSIKKLIRLIVLTQTFQQSSKPSSEAIDRDPQNRLLQHYPARRMEAEAVRDAILFASGRLDRQLYGMSVQPFREKPYADRRLFPGPLDGDGRRSIYIKNNLMEAPKFLAAFDFPVAKLPKADAT